jgi:hypothetical protein
LHPAHSRVTAVFDNYVAEIRLDEKPVQLALWDTAYVLACSFLARALTMYTAAKKNMK